MTMLSTNAVNALMQAIAQKGKHKGKLLARCPRMNTDAAAAWQGAMLVVNPYKVSVGRLMFMSQEQRSLMNEVTAWFERIPRDHMLASDRDRKILSKLGVW